MVYLEKKEEIERILDIVKMQKDLLHCYKNELNKTREEYKNQQVKCNEISSLIQDVKRIQKELNESEKKISKLEDLLYIVTLLLLFFLLFVVTTFYGAVLSIVIPILGLCFDFCFSVIQKKIRFAFQQAKEESEELEELKEEYNRDLEDIGRKIRTIQEENKRVESKLLENEMKLDNLYLEDAAAIFGEDELNFEEKKKRMINR